MKERISRVGQVSEPGQISFFERAVPDPQPGKVIIKVRASAICGSDLHIFKGKHPAVSLPATIGHEFSGDIVAVGEGVRNVSIGDRVTLEPCVTCGTCEACRHGDYGYCEHISFTYRNGDGAMADYLTADARYLYQLPDYLTYSTGALIEPLSVAVHAVKRADIQLGERVLIMGAGAIGILIAAVCKKRGAGEVIIADFSDERLAMAREMGATITVNAGKEKMEDVVTAVTGGSGVDKSFECVGRESSFLQAMMTLKRNGLATIVGIFENPDITIPASRFVTHEIRVQGAQGYCWDFPNAIKIARELDLDRLITHRFPLEDLYKAMETCLDKDSGSMKVILEP